MSKYREWNFNLSAKRTSVYQQSKREFQSEIQAAKIYHDSANPVCIYLMTMAWVPGNLQKIWNHKMVDNIQGATWLWREHKNTGQDDVWECAMYHLEEHEEVNSSSERLSAGNLSPKIFYLNIIEGRSLMKVCTAYNQLYPTSARWDMSFNYRLFIMTLSLPCPRSGYDCFSLLWTGHGMRGNWLHLPSSHFLVSEEIWKCDKTRIG